MKAISIVGVILVGLIASPSVVLAQTAKEVVEKAIEAHGGLDNLKKYPAAQAKMKGTISIMNLSVPIEGESTYALPDMGKNTMTMDLLGQKISVSQVINNGKIRMVANGADVPVSDSLKAELTESLYLQSVGQLFPLLDDKKFELSLIKNPEKVDGNEVVGVLVKSKGHKEIKLFFDAKTFVERAMERKGLDPAEQEVDQKLICLEFKKIDGILRATKCEMTNDGKKFMTFEVTDIKHLEKVDKKLFDLAD